LTNCINPICFESGKKFVLDNAGNEPGIYRLPEW
jgi:hypothetical protein